MQKDSAEIKRQRLLTLAREYRKLGYTVITRPTKDQLPDFLASFQPDMLAYNQQEHVVFLVKSQETLTTSPELLGIARILQDKQDWRFELVVTNPHIKDSVLTASDRLLNPSVVLERLQESQRLSEQEHGEAAFLLAWSAVEAVLRNLARKEGVSPERSTSEAIAKNLFAHGLLDKEQYETLIEGVKVRNTLMHGYQNPHTFAAIFKKLLHIAQQIVNEEQLVPAY